MKKGIKFALLLVLAYILSFSQLFPARADDDPPPPDTADIITLARAWDVAPGSTSSNPFYLTDFGGNLFFAANGNNGLGTELWQLGNPNPIDIYPGAPSSAPVFLTPFNGYLYFSADGGDGAGVELWRYIPGVGVSRAADIYVGAGSSFPAFFAVYNNKLYFSANGNDGAGAEIWQYDTTNGAMRVTDIYMGANSSNPTELILYDKELYFHANGNDGAGTELWKYNSTQGAMRVLDLRPGIEGSEIRYPAVYNGALYFQANPNDGTGAELWRYDPLNGAQLVADINMMGDSLPYSLRVYNGALYFGADGGDNAGMELWKYDTLHGAARVADIYPGSGSSVPTELAVVNNALYFAANGNDGAGRELWVYSNTATARYRPTKSYEGWLLESSENSSIGGGINNSAAVLNLGDDSLNRQYRSILSFDTSTLPDNAMVLGVTLKIRRQGLVGTNPFTTHGNILVDIMKGAFSGNLALQASDFQAAPSKVGVGVIRNRPDPNNWFTSNLAKTAFAWVNRKGVTQLRLRFSKDDNNDNSADFLKFYSANSLNYTDYPLLEVKYYIP